MTFQIAPPSLTDEQNRALGAIDEFMADTSRQVFGLHGLAGTGKTTLLQHIAKRHEYGVLCSLTGKAASVLRRRTGLPAQTLHSFFYQLTEAKKDKKGMALLEFDRVHYVGELSGDLILLDESSMISEEIAADLLRTGARIIACGDPGQLPPVKGRRFFDKPDFTLTQIHRQALESPIIRQAHAVRNGKPYCNDGPDFRVTDNGGTDADLLDAEVVLTWTNATKNYLNQKCRDVRGYWQPGPQVGEPLVCLKNAAGWGVFNGGVYTLLQPFIDGDRAITLDVDGVAKRIPGVTFVGMKSGLGEGRESITSFDFGYAMTVHKAQGSEWDSVVLCDECRAASGRREWLYTGLTRARERILVVR